MIIRWKRVTGLSIYGLSVCLLAALGSWQFQRGQNKAEIESAMDSVPVVKELAAPPADWNQLAYQTVVLEGQWLYNKVFLLQNRIYQGIVGFEVLTPFTLAGGGTILVNRGWIDSASSAEVGAANTADTAPSGTLYLPERGFRLGDTFAGDPTWPQPALYLDIEALANRLGKPLEPAVLVLDKAHPATFVRLWQPTNMPASRHYGYALQWWGLLAALLVLGYFWRRKQWESDK